MLNALDLLEAFGGGEPEQGVSAIAARPGLPKNNVFRILAAGARLPARTPLTVADPAVLLDRLPVIARKGYAVDDGEYAADVRCVAAPVRDHSRRVVAAISLSGPASRMTPARVERELLARLSAAALALSERLGYPADR